MLWVHGTGVCVWEVFRRLLVDMVLESTHFLLLINWVHYVPCAHGSNDLSFDFSFLLLSFQTQPAQRNLLLQNLLLFSWLLVWIVVNDHELLWLINFLRIHRLLSIGNTLVEFPASCLLIGLC